MKLGERIRGLRKKKYTQEELAERLGVHVNTIVRWERGERMPTADKLKALADILGTTPSELLSSEDSQSLANKNESALPLSPQPYTQEQINKGMLVYTLSNGEKIELPPIQASYDFLRDMAIHAARTAVV
ncbi:MAG: helix-turn-helix transcriptional regulator [Synergistaceae bacterium]|nr:helix-turn-helix transcriptional regulator [Synergistaceae bacterium]